MHRIPRLLLMALATISVAACQYASPNAPPVGSVSAPTFVAESSSGAPSLSSMSTQELCELRRTREEGRPFRQEALDEIRERGEFTTAEIEQIVDGEIELGMREEVVLCARAGDRWDAHPDSSAVYDELLRFIGRDDTRYVYLKDGLVIRTSPAQRDDPGLCPPTISTLGGQRGAHRDTEVIGGRGSGCSTSLDSY